MSDEDRDVDIESDEDDEANSAATQFMTQAEKRAHHNALERKRRDHIKESFLSLRDSVPALHGEKVVCQTETSSSASSSLKQQASRAQILKQATDYIQLMSRKNSHHQQDIDNLKKQNYQLESQVRALEKAKVAGTYITSQNVDVVSRGAAFNGASDSESSSGESEPEEQPVPPRKKLKT